MLRRIAHSERLRARRTEGHAEAVLAIVGRCERVGSGQGGHAVAAVPPDRAPVAGCPVAKGVLDRDDGAQCHGSLGLAGQGQEKLRRLARIDCQWRSRRVAGVGCVADRQCLITGRAQTDGKCIVPWSAAVKV